MPSLTRSYPIRKAAQKTVLAAAFATSLLAGCDRPAAPPLNYYEVRLEATATNEKDCREQVLVLFEPVKIASEPLGSLYETKAYADRPLIEGKPVLDGPNNWECHFTYRSRDLAPGTWTITGTFPSGGSQHCSREVLPGHLGHVRLDQEEGCVEFDRPGTEVDARQSSPS